jgi:hypothetical protein
MNKPVFNQNLNLMDQIVLEGNSYLAKIVDDVILNVKLKEFKILELSDYIEIQEWANKVAPNKKIINLFEFGQGSSASRETREYASSSKGNTISIGAAIVVNNLGQQLIADYYLKFNHPINPTKVFYKKEKAILWIKNNFLPELLRE